MNSLGEVTPRAIGNGGGGPVVNSLDEVTLRASGNGGGWGESHSFSSALRGSGRALLRARVELLLTALGLLAAHLLRSHGHRGDGQVALLACWAAAALGLALLMRAGELQLAFRCPRLDALSVVPGTAQLPWPTLRAADAALRTLAEDGGDLRAFFPDARRELAQAACRAIEAHRRLARAQRHLGPRGAGSGLHAPFLTGARDDGGARSGESLLAQQRHAAERELLALTSTLRDLRARFAAATAPALREPDALPALAALAQRSDALTAAHDSLTEPRDSLGEHRDSRAAADAWRGARESLRLNEEDRS